MITSAGGETAPRSKKGGNYASCADANHAGPKMKKNHAVDSADTNGR
jgi:hypothetical protein